MRVCAKVTTHGLFVSLSLATLADAKKAFTAHTEDAPYTTAEGHGELNTVFCLQQKLDCSFISRKEGGKAAIRFLSTCGSAFLQEAVSVSSVPDTSGAGWELE